MTQLHLHPSAGDDHDHRQPPGAAPSDGYLRRDWTPLQPAWNTMPSADLGIGVITHNRRSRLQWLVEALRAYTRTPFHLVIADDGSTDGSASWARESGLPVVTGRSRGVAWNKNRALYWLMHRSHCRKLLLIEDDIYPVRSGWEQGWVEALDRVPHLNYTPEGTFGATEATLGSYRGLPLLNTVGGALMALTREAVYQVGFLDTRFRGYGVEHVEYTRRLQRARLHPERGFLTLRDGSLSGHGGTAPEAGRAEELRFNQLVAAKLKDEPVWRPPARDGAEATILAHEQHRAAWPHAGFAEPRACRVSVLCATRTESLARRMAASFGKDPNVEFVWAWNGAGSPDLPGRVVRYDSRRFNYPEAYNRAAQHSTGSVLLLVNDDVQLTCRGLPARLLDLYRRRPELGVAYGGMEGDWEAFDDPCAPAWEGCCWAIGYEAFAAMGGLEETLIGYGADEFVVETRMRRLGRPGVRLRGWTYEHLEHQTFGKADRLEWNWRRFPVELGWAVSEACPDSELARRCQQTLSLIRQRDGSDPGYELAMTGDGQGGLEAPLHPERAPDGVDEFFDLAEDPEVDGLAHSSGDRGDVPTGPVDTPLPAHPVTTPGVHGSAAAAVDPADLSLRAASLGADLGIGVISFNRRPQVQRCVQQIHQLTQVPFHLVIADDGSADGTVEWAREHGIPVVTGENRGVAWNKNRALHWLMHRTRCTKLLLIEDDIHPVRPGWESGWMAALERVAHLNLSPPEACPHGSETVLGSFHGLPLLNWVGGALMAMTRRGVEAVGYLDTRFRGYGREHRELTQRYQRARLHPADGYLTLRDGSLSTHGPCLAQPGRLEQWFRNCALYYDIADDPVWRPPALGAEEEARLAEEQRLGWELWRNAAP